MKISTHHNCFGRVASTYIYKDIIILVKVDACCVMGKNCVLFFWWWRGYIADLGSYRIKTVCIFFYLFIFLSGTNSISGTNYMRNYKPAVVPPSFSSPSFCDPNELTENDKLNLNPFQLQSFTVQSYLSRTPPHPVLCTLNIFKQIAV